jgi:hypothetical protein
MLARREQVLLEELALVCARCPGVEVVRAPTGITLSASGPEGFDMALLIDDRRYVLTFDQWQEAFDDAAAARRLLEAALAGSARLRVDLIAGHRWRWTLERLQGSGTWTAESTITHPVWRLWGRRETAYLRNAYPLLA